MLHLEITCGKAVMGAFELLSGQSRGIKPGPVINIPPILFRPIQFKIQPPSHTPLAQPARRLNLSNSSAHLLESAASGIQDPELAEALYRLSKHNRVDKQ